MYYMPQRYGAFECSVKYDEESLRRFLDVCPFQKNRYCDDIMPDICWAIINHYSIGLLKNRDEEIELYKFFRIDVLQVFRQM